MDTLLDVIWGLKGMLGILFLVFVLGKMVRGWRKVKKNWILIGALCLLGGNAEAAPVTCAGAGCNPETQHCTQYTEGGVLAYQCEDGPEPWFSADQTAQGSLRAQWLTALSAGLLLFICFSTRFRP